MLWVSIMVGIFEVEGTTLGANEEATLGNCVGDLLWVGDCDVEGARVVGA